MSLSSTSIHATPKVASFLIFSFAIRTTTSFSSSNHIRGLASFANTFADGTLSSSTQINASPPSSSSSAYTVVTSTTATSPPSTQKRKSQTTYSTNGVGSISTLSMSSISDDSLTSQSSKTLIQELPDGIVEVLSAAFLITANTIGPSMMVVPKVMAGPGFLISGSIMTGVWGVNLLSALLIAEVAINQYETSSCDVPSSFKDFAEINLQSKAGGIFVSFLSIFVNWCVVSFNLIQMGEIVITNLPTFSGAILEMPSIPHATAINTATIIAAVGWGALVATQTNKRLSGVASLCCMGLFASFASILIPGLASVQSDPLAFVSVTTDISSLSGSLGDAALGALPIFVAVMIFQNIIPTVVKMLNYNREKCVLAIAMGSVVPLLMHLSFSYAVLGGGINLDLETGGPLLNVFSTVSVVGSTMACIMSLAGEFGSFLEAKNDNGIATDGRSIAMAVSSPTSDSEQGGDSDDTASIPAITLAVLPPLLAGIYFSGGEEFVQAISISGSYASPLLYGVIPIILAWNQRNGNKSKSNGFDDIWKPPQVNRTTSLTAVNVSSIFQSILTRGNEERNENEKLRNGSQELAPGGSLGLGLLGVSSVLLISQSVMTDFAGMI